MCIDFILLFGVQNVFRRGVVLVLISEASGKTLRVRENGDVEGKGGEGTLGRYAYIIHIRYHL